MNFAVFVSGNGTNLQAIIEAAKKGKVKGKIALVVSDNPQAFALKRAKKAGIKSLVIKPTDFFDKKSYEKALVGYLSREKIHFIVLAGFMRILSPFLVRKYRHKILNIHPSLLPVFKGAHAIKDAFLSGAKVTGVTIHFVDEKVDGGPIILQEVIPISPRDTLATLEEKIHKVEHKIYPKAIDLFIRRRLRIVGRKVRVI